MRALEIAETEDGFARRLGAMGASADHKNRRGDILPRAKARFEPGRVEPAGWPSAFSFPDGSTDDMFLGRRRKCKGARRRPRHVVRVVGTDRKGPARGRHRGSSGTAELTGGGRLFVDTACCSWWPRTSINGTSDRASFDAGAKRQGKVVTVELVAQPVIPGRGGGSARQLCHPGIKSRSR